MKSKESTNIPIGLGEKAFDDALAAIRVIPKSYLRNEREQLMAAYAFMHCSLFTGDGDIEFSRDGMAVGNIIRTQIPAKFDDFYRKYKSLGAKSFHARCSLMEKSDKMPNHWHQYALISSEYDFMYKFMCDETDGAAIFHPGYMCNQDNYEKIRSETLDYIRLLKKGKPLPPIVEKQNESPIRCYATRIQEEKYHATRDDIFAGEDCHFLCNRNDFHFNRLKSIRCCGECEMLEKSYRMLVGEALDEKSAKDLMDLVEDAGLFNKNADGKPITCHGCIRACAAPGKETCPREVRKAIDAIFGLWSACYRELPMN